MKTIIAFCIVLMTILFVACDNIDMDKISDEDLDRISNNLIVCDPPYMRHASECCLDQNENKICDEDEESNIKPDSVATVEEIELAGTERIIINSENWQDIYSAMLYSNLVKVGSNFILGEKQSESVLNTIPEGSKLVLLDSKSVPVIQDYQMSLKEKGFATTEYGLSNFNLELAKLLDVKNYIIIPNTYGYDAVSVAPYAMRTGSYVLFISNNYANDVINFLDNTKVGSVMLYGDVDSSIGVQLQKFNPTIINEGGRFSNNVEIVKEYLKISDTKQVILTSGEFIEKEIMSGAEPVILISNDEQYKVTMDFLRASNFEIGILIGTDLVGAATYIRRNTPLSVYVKFAQGAGAPQGAISQVEALDMFYLPSDTD